MQSPNLENITPSHQQEWLESKVDRDLIKLNVKSLIGDAVYAHLLYGLESTDRRNDGRLRDRWLFQSAHAANGGWWCSGIDVLTGQDSDWGCFKPDNPRMTYGKDKPIKYEHPPKVQTEIFALSVPDGTWSQIAKKWGVEQTGDNFWQWVINNVQVPLVITEGAKKAGALLSAGYPAIAIPGINNGYRTSELKEAELIPQIKVFCSRWREINIAFDQDRKYKTRQNVDAAIALFAELLEKEKARAFVLEWRHTDGKGIDDVIAIRGSEFLEFIYNRRLPIAKWKENKYKKTPRLDYDKVLEFLELELGKRLTFNDLSGQILLDEQVLHLDNTLKFYFWEKFGIKTTSDNLIDGITYIAKKNSFNPVHRYLESVAKYARAISIDNLATRFLGTTEDIYDVMLKKWLIAAVARVYQPGCKVDNALILQGRQGIGKSSFFAILGGKWFDDSLEDINSKDALLVLNKCWIQELAEFERINTRRSAEEVKAFVTRRSDCFRAPYGREATEHPRRSIICGSVNKSSFLIDETGNRRFWIIRVNPELERIDLDELRSCVDGIWATAVEKYQAGSQWWLEPEEEKISRENNQDFEIEDVWSEHVETYLGSKTEITVFDILVDVFKIDVALHDRKQQMRITSILQRLGWQKGKRKQINGTRKQYWYSPEKKVFKVSNWGMASGSDRQKPQGERGLQSAKPKNEGVSPRNTSLQLNQNDIPKNLGVSQPESIQGNGHSQSRQTPYPTQRVSKLSKQKGEYFIVPSQPPIPEKKYPQYKCPEAPYQKGDFVVYDHKKYKVVACGHTHVQLEGVENAIALWQVEPFDQKN